MANDTTVNIDEERATRKVWQEWRGNEVRFGASKCGYRLVFALVAAVDPARSVRETGVSLLPDPATLY